jgi:hypothetical protein
MRDRDTVGWWAFDLLEASPGNCGYHALRWEFSPRLPFLAEGEARGFMHQFWDLLVGYRICGTLRNQSGSTGGIRAHRK